LEKLIDHLAGFISGRRMELFERVLDHRTRYITVVLEDIRQAQNASAVLRSCECFGIQDIHIIENQYRYKINPDVVRGASKWLNIIRYRGKEYNTPDAVNRLRERDYRIVATTVREGAMALEDFDVQNGKFALFFGSEWTGLTDEMLAIADEQIRIPMHGFTGSFNISVSAAIILHHVTLKLHQSAVDWKLDPGEREEILVRWMMKSIKHLRGKSPEELSIPE
jgi:tRNA (guanosine-2'-O-)-methyltransferase